MPRLPRPAVRFVWRCLTPMVCLALAACGEPDYRTLHHGSGDFADLRGKHVLINYWAAWCKPCLEEIPELNAFAASYGDKVVVLGVNYDRLDEATLRQQAESFAIGFPVLLTDPAARLGYPRPTVLPTTLVLAPDGTVQTALMGAQSGASLAAALGLPATSGARESAGSTPAMPKAANAN